MKNTSKKCSQLVGRKKPKLGTKARNTLEVLIDYHGKPISEHLLIRLSGADYIEASVAALRNMGWVIVSSVRHVRDGYGRSRGIATYSLNQINNGIKLELLKEKLMILERGQA